MDVSDVHMTIADTVARLDRSGDGSLSMTVRNDDGVTEHLGMVATPDGGRGVLVGGKSAEGNGSLSAAGILLLSGTTVTARRHRRAHAAGGPAVRHGRNGQVPGTSRLILALLTDARASDPTPLRILPWRR
ncbi:hypothetical protein OG568_24855 [Streptomyces sp. NBC_01450]|uniref:hypothetical protein n=1 Tax=Streptomyces sp. NBC_01450 TaxID=2903871 RepID=UPI002E3201A3|nr:hypothetical protein [Streptomyces sp. NBC_01450]